MFTEVIKLPRGSANTEGVQGVVEHEPGIPETQGVLYRLLEISLKDISLEDMLEGIIDEIISVESIVLESKGSILLVEDESNILVMKAQRGLAKPLLSLCAQVPFGRCICGRAASSGEIEFADKIDERHENRFDGIMPHGHYCVPLIDEGKVVGVINLYVKEGHDRNDLEEEFLRSVANVLVGIIKRKKSEEFLRKSEEKYSALVEESHDGIVMIQDGVFRFLNPEMLRITGFSKDDVLGRPFIDFVALEFRDHVMDRYKKRMSGEEVESKYEIGVLTKEGGMVPVEVNASIIDYEGRPADMAIMRDITERKEAEEELLLRTKKIEDQAKELSAMNEEITAMNEELQASQNDLLKANQELEIRVEDRMSDLKESKQKYKLLFNTFANPISLFDMGGTLLMINEAGAKKLGGIPTDFIGKSVDELIPDMADEYLERNRQVMESGKGAEYEDEFDLPTGKLWIWSNTQPMKDASGKIFAVQVISYDITERKKAEKELKDRVHELEKWQRLTVGREIRMKELKVENRNVKEEIERLKVAR